MEQPRVLLGVLRGGLRNYVYTIVISKGEWLVARMRVFWILRAVLVSLLVGWLTRLARNQYLYASRCVATR